MVRPSAEVALAFGTTNEAAPSLRSPWHDDCYTRNVTMISQALKNASRQSSERVSHVTALGAWDAEPSVGPTLELLLLPRPSTDSAYLCYRYEEVAARAAAAAGAGVGYPLREPKVRLAEFIRTARPRRGSLADAARPRR